MKTLLTTLLIVSLFAGAACAQWEDLNQLVLVAGNPDEPYGYGSYTCLYGYGAGEIHLLLLNAVNENNGYSIENIGGFECAISVPDGVLVTGAVLPPNCINFLTAPEFLVGANIPVHGQQTLLATLNVVIWPAPTGDFHPVLVTPVQERYQSVPGFAAITDLNDDYSITIALSNGGGYELPAFWIINNEPNGAQGASSPVWPGPCVVDSDSESWSDMKAMFR